MSGRPTSHQCGYSDGVPGKVIWDGRNGRCDRCGVQFRWEEADEAHEQLDGQLGD